MSEEIKNPDQPESTNTFPPLELEEDALCAALEALIFMSEKPLSTQKLRTLLNPTFSLDLMRKALFDLKTHFESSTHGLELVEVGGGWKLRTKMQQKEICKRLTPPKQERLSQGALETLSIIAYHQPTMKETVDRTRGVDSGHFLRKLLHQGLIRIAGRSDLPGKPLLYETTQKFLEVFSLTSLQDLPSEQEIESMLPKSQTEDPEEAILKPLQKALEKMGKLSNTFQNQEEEEAFLKEIREKIKKIPTSTPSLDAKKENINTDRSE